MICIHTCSQCNKQSALLYARLGQAIKAVWCERTWCLMAQSLCLASHVVGARLSMPMYISSTGRLWRVSAPGAHGCSRGGTSTYRIAFHWDDSVHKGTGEDATRQDNQTGLLFCCT
jgi:hypothetical protein